MKLRILFGEKRNVKITFPDKLKTRPTTSRAKDIMFNTININEYDLIVDLFSGSGSLGIESLSLGAQNVVFIEKDKYVWKLLKNNLLKLKFDATKYKVENKDFRIYLKNNSFDKKTLFFIDPPFSVDKYYDLILEWINNQNNNTYIIESKNDISSYLEKSKILKYKKLGFKYLYIFEN